MTPVSSRRTWLFLVGQSALARSLAGPALARPPQSTAPNPEVELEAQARKAGITGWRTVRTDRYLVAGDAAQDFLQAASKLCEGLADDFLDHFQKRGFKVKAPAGRLVVVALSGPDAFAKFEGIELAQAIGGQYDPATNRLVIFDQRGKAQAGPRDERANTVALMHEATHQLTFNCGLLDRTRTIPLAVSEGLATYGETRRPDGRTKVGALNTERVQVLAASSHGGGSWIALDRLIGDDAPFGDPATQQMAYAQAWLLVHTMLADEKSRSSWKRYLDGLAAEPAVGRLELARERLGDLQALDAMLRQVARSRLRGGVRR